MNSESIQSTIVHTDVNIVRETGLDQFYTIPTCAKQCIDKINELYNITDFDLIIEPSAGNGSFFNQIVHTSKVGIDLSPQHPAIIQQDFFSYYPPSGKTRIATIGNPPFGKISSLAIKFFNHAAQWSDIIAFIIPRTFRKISVQNKLDKSFHLVHDNEIPNKPCCFSPPMAVKCCFQIWERRVEHRPFVELPTKHADWIFLSFGPIDENGQPTPPDGADFAMRAYGGKIGEIIQTDLHVLRPKSWHWFSSNINTDVLISRFQMLDYSNSLNTARQNSMGRAELVQLYKQYISNHSH